MAARQGEVAIMRLLLDKGANIEAAANDGETALHKAAKYGKVVTLSVTP